MLLLVISLSTLSYAEMRPCTRAAYNVSDIYKQAVVTSDINLKRQYFNQALELGDLGLRICSVYGDTGGMKTREIMDYMALARRGLKGENVPGSNNIFGNIIFNTFNGKSNENAALVKDWKKDWNKHTKKKQTKPRKKLPVSPSGYTCGEAGDKEGTYLCMDCTWFDKDRKYHTSMHSSCGE